MRVANMYGYYYGSGSSVSYSAEYQNILDKWAADGIALPDSARKAKDNAYIISLKDLGLWTKKDIYYNLVAHNEDAALYNWKNPTAFKLSKVGGLTFAANQGFTPDGSTGYLNTGWDPGTNGINFLQDEAGFGGHINTNTNVGVDFGSNAASFNNAAWFSSRNVSDQFGNRLNDASTFTQAGITTSVGFWHARRTSSTAREVFKNGVSVKSTAVGASQTRSTVDFYIGANNNNGAAASFSARQYSCFWAGASLSGLESALYTAWNTYFTSL